jgi:hypothetical protein
MKPKAPKKRDPKPKEVSGKYNDPANPFEYKSEYFKSGLFHNYFDGIIKTITQKDVRFIKTFELDKNFLDDFIND